MLIRKLTEEDYDFAIELFFALDKLHISARPDWFQERQREEIFPKVHFSASVIDPECLFLGAFDGNGTMAGLARATLWQDSGMIKGLKNVCLDNIYVLPDFRSQGVASRLYQMVEQWARGLGAQRLELHVWDFNKEALLAYEAWGLQPQRHVLEKELTAHEAD